MTNFQPNFFINIDKLIFNFNSEICFKNEPTNPYFKIQSQKKRFNSLYRYSYSVYYNDVLFACINNSNFNDSTSSQLIIDNKALLTNDYIDVIKLFYTTYNITDFSLSILEIALNTNDNLLKKWYSFFKRDKEYLLNIKKGYYEFPILHTSKSRFENNLSNDTIYIKKRGAAIEMRIENKSFEVATKINRGFRDKRYILDSYSDVLNLNTDVYRLEMIINFRLLRKASKSVVYCHNDNIYNIISVTEYNKLSDYKKRQYKAYSNQLPKTIDLDLLNDRDFLLSFFNNYSIFDYKKLILTTPKLLKFDNVLNILKSKPTREKDIELSESILKYNTNDLSDIFESICNKYND